MNIRERLNSLSGNASTWFYSRTTREQFLLAGLAAVAAVALLYTAVWSPLSAHRDAAVSDIARYDTLMAEVRLAGPAGLDPATGLAQGAQAPSIAGSAADHGLLVRRIEPEGENTRLSFEDAEFARILDWIASMEDAGIARVSAVQIDRRPAPGVVNAQITLEN
jgi:general secretion pathway protein M